LEYLEQGFGRDKFDPFILEYFNHFAFQTLTTEVFLDYLDEKLAALDAGLGLSTTQNAEIARTWFIQVAKRRFEPVYEQLEAHLNRHGRARLITPIYGALAANGHDAELANSMFQKARSSYHPLTIGYIERTLKRVAEAQ
jgi:hypothetical protein